MLGNFDATNIPPSQGGGGHPPGMFDFRITNTYAKPTKAGDGGMFIVEFTSPVGRIENRYNLWNSSAQAVEIAQKELSALCHATGIIRISFPANQDGSPNLAMAGAELRGGVGRMEIVPQIDKATGQPTSYVDLKRVFDKNGNEPGRAPAQPQPMQQPAPAQQQSPPMQQTPSGGWGAPQQQPQAQPNWQQNQQPAGAAPPWGQR